MKVLHVIPAVSPRYGGPSNALMPMCRALLSQGVDVQIATTDAEPGGHIQVELGSPTVYEGIPAIFFHKQWSEAFTFSYPLARWLKTHVMDYDLVDIHGVFSHSCLAASRACRKYGVPYVIRPHGHLEQWGLDQKAGRKKVFLKAVGMKMLRNAAAINYVSASEQHSSERALAVNHGVTIPLGINLDNLVAPLSGDRDPDLRPYVLVLSRLLPSKGIDVLLKAFLNVRKDPRLSAWKLVIAGNGPAQYVANLKQLIAESESEDSVLLAGWLEGERKALAVAGAGLLALPSHHEAFGLCVVEAMAQGVPVLVSPQNGLATQIQTACAGWVAPVDTKSIADTLLGVLGDREERRRRGEAGRKLSRKFSWEIVAGQLINLYESVIAGSNRDCD